MFEEYLRQFRTNPRAETMLPLVSYYRRTKRWHTVFDDYPFYYRYCMRALGEPVSERTPLPRNEEQYQNFDWDLYQLARFDITEFIIDSDTVKRYPRLDYIDNVSTVVFLEPRVRVFQSFQFPLHQLYEIGHRSRDTDMIIEEELPRVPEDLEELYEYYLIETISEEVLDIFLPMHYSIHDYLTSPEAYNRPPRGFVEGYIIPQPDLNEQLGETISEWVEEAIYHYRGNHIL